MSILLPVADAALRWLLTESQRQRVELGGLTAGLRAGLRIVSVTLGTAGVFGLSAAWLGIRDDSGGGLGGLVALVTGPLGFAGVVGGLGCWAAIDADRKAHPGRNPPSPGIRLLLQIAGAAFVMVAVWLGLITVLALGDGARYMRGLGVLFGPAALAALVGGIQCFRDRSA